MNLENLNEIGLSKGEIKVYSAVLELGISNLNKIQEKTGIERRNIYDILNKLIDKGLVSYIIERGKRTYRCTHPNKILEEIKSKEKNLLFLKQQIPEIVQKFKSEKPEVNAEVYRGNESIKSLLNEVLDYKESFWMGGNSFERYSTVPKSLEIWFTNWMERRIEKKHIMYDLVSYGTSLKGLEPNKINKHKKSYYKYCQLPKDLYVPMVILIFGNKVAQILWSEKSFAFIMESEKIKNSFIKYFKHFWREPY